MVIAPTEPSSIRIGPFEIMHNESGEPIRLPRSNEETTFLALDTRSKALVELHAFTGAGFRGLELLRRVEMTRELSGPVWNVAQEWGMDDEVPYYVTALNDGELLGKFFERNRALPEAVAVRLALQLATSMEDLLECGDLAGTVSFSHILLGQEGDAPHLRVTDLGLSRLGPNRCAATEWRLVRGVCRVAWQLLTGKECPASFGPRLPAVLLFSRWPSGLRTLLQQVLAESRSHLSLSHVTAVMRESLTALNRSVASGAAQRIWLRSGVATPQSLLTTLLPQCPGLAAFIPEQSRPRGRVPRGKTFLPTVGLGDRPTVIDPLQNGLRKIGEPQEWAAAKAPTSSQLTDNVIVPLPTPAPSADAMPALPEQSVGVADEVPAAEIPLDTGKSVKSLRIGRQHLAALKAMSGPLLVSQS